MTDDDIYKNSTLTQKLTHEKWKKYKVLFTDIDDTYLCQTSTPEQSHKATKAIQNLTEFLAQHSIPIIAVTGRNIESVLLGQHSEEKLPQFDVIASSVGTEMWIHTSGGKYLLDKAYDTKIRQDSDFKRDKIYDICREYLSINKLSDPDLKMSFQTDVFETERPLKVSFNFESSINTAISIKNRLKYFLKKRGFSNVKIIVSTGLKLENMKYLYNCDVVAATKATAVAYIQRKFNCKGIVAGDSANDRHMIFNAGDAAIVVGMCKDDLMREIKENVVRNKHKYIATVKMDDNNERIFYIEPVETQRIGPESILRALQLFKEYDFLLTSSTIFTLPPLLIKA